MNVNEQHIIFATQALADAKNLITTLEESVLILETYPAIKKDTSARQNTDLLCSVAASIGAAKGCADMLVRGLRYVRTNPSLAGE